MASSSGSEDALDIFRRRLGAAGLKSTRQRDVIVETFFDLDRHISVEELHEILKQKNLGIGYATVYRTMKVLVEHGMAKGRDFGDGITRFDPMVGQKEHDHLICIDCGEVFEFTDEQLNMRQHQMAASLGSFEVQRRKLELYVTCTDPTCPRRPKHK